MILHRFVSKKEHYLQYHVKLKSFLFILVEYSQEKRKNEYVKPENDSKLLNCMSE